MHTNTDKRPSERRGFSSARTISYLTTCTIAVAFSSVLFQAYLESQQLSRITALASGLVRLEHDPAVRLQNLEAGGPRVAIAYGACSDLYVDVADFLNYTGEADAGTATDEDDIERLNDVASERDLRRSFGYYFERGAAAERFTSNTAMFRALIERLGSPASANARTRSDLGGNAPLMGQRFQLDGAHVLLGAQISPALRRRLSESIRIVGPEATDAPDDVHLIVEYKTGDRWGPLMAPRANRYILHNDHANPGLNALDAFGDALHDFRPRLLVICGLQMLDTYPFADGGQREHLLQRVATQMAEQPADRTLVHVEMASFVDDRFVRLLRQLIVPRADSLGMNEQELDALVHFERFGTVSRGSESNPRVGQTLDRMRELFVALRRRPMGGPVDGRKVSRLHVHTLAFQAILVDRRADKWRHSEQAAAKAALTAYRTVCRSTIINPESATLLLDDSFSTSAEPGGGRRMQLNASEPVSCWTESVLGGAAGDDVQICVAPVLVCRVARQTAGAGDNISAAGLILQI